MFHPLQPALIGLSWVLLVQTMLAQQAPVFREVPPAQEVEEEELALTPSRGLPAIFRTTQEQVAESEPEPANAPAKNTSAPATGPNQYFDTKTSGPMNPRLDGPGYHTGWDTVKGARILTLSIPAPRGQIVDRNGVSFAQNVVVHYLGVKLPFIDGKPDREILRYTREKLAMANAALGKNWQLRDDVILSHYQHRRWLPLMFSPLPLTNVEKDQITKMAIPELQLLPTYQRFYPQKSLAGHVIGYVGKRPPWPKGEIPDGEHMWPTSQGVRGVEKAFDGQLTGTPGRVQIIYNGKGEPAEKTIIQHPIPGQNIVLSLDIPMQRLAEQLLEEHVRRGAFVVMDANTGDVMAMASYPTFDVNEFVPRISAKRFFILNNDPEKPLYGRAFQGVYPPASVFKITSALGMLEAGTIDENDRFACPKAFTIGNRIAHNWAKYDEGRMNVIGAITRSCNTWFYQGAMDTPHKHITDMGVALGYGSKAGVFIEEESGIMPTNEWWREKFKADIGKGDLANISIGQGSVEATPLQVARAMAAVGNRKSLLGARLVLQIQDYSGRVSRTFDVSERTLGISTYDLEIVRKGMWHVVNGARGTGKNAKHETIEVAGKTGTGQWKPAQDQNLAWFAGFAPADFPVYSFAAVYEGEPGESVSGGRLAAPIIGEFFKQHLEDEAQMLAFQERSDQIRAMNWHLIASIDISAGAVIEGGGRSSSGRGSSSRGSSSGSSSSSQPPAAAKPPRSFLRKLFGNRKRR